MDNLLGIKELKDIIIFGCKFTNAIDKSLVDKKITITDATNFISPLLSLKDALEGIGTVLAEIKDLNAAEKAELIASVSLELELDPVKVEPMIEEVLNSALTIYMAYNKISTMLKK